MGNHVCSPAPLLKAYLEATPNYPKLVEEHHDKIYPGPHCWNEGCPVLLERVCFHPNQSRLSNWVILREREPVMWKGGDICWAVWKEQSSTDGCRGPFLLHHHPLPNHSSLKQTLATDVSSDSMGKGGRCSASIKPEVP